jgi:hypothetical protein
MQRVTAMIEPPSGKVPPAHLSGNSEYRLKHETRAVASGTQDEGLEELPGRQT